MALYIIDDSIVYVMRWAHIQVFLKCPNAGKYGPE